MIIFTKLIFFFLLLQYNFSYAIETSKVLFSINEKPYTSIDLNQRIKYLDLLTNNEIMLTEREILEDFIAVLVFNEFAIKKK